VPLDRRGHEGRPDATSAPPALDEHCELADAEAALANVDHPDDRAVGLGDKGGCRRRGELVRAGIDVDGRLRRDPSRSSATAARSSAISRASSGRTGRTSNSGTA
jgi:hypothetical protein